VNSGIKRFYSSLPHLGHRILECALYDSASNRVERGGKTHKGGICAEVGGDPNLFPAEVLINDIKYCDGQGLLGDCQKVVLVDTFVVAYLVVITDPAGVDHDPALLVGLGVEQIVTFRAEVQ